MCGRSGSANLSLLCGAGCPGDKWRINFSRVQWNVTWSEEQQRYNKEPPDQPGYNFVWAPQWQVQMHQPETWGYVQFSTSSGGCVPATVWSWGLHGAGGVLTDGVKQCVFLACFDSSKARPGQHLSSRAVAIMSLLCPAVEEAAASPTNFAPDATWPARALLMDVYYAQTLCWQVRTTGMPRTAQQ